MSINCVKDSITSAHHKSFVRDSASKDKVQKVADTNIREQEHLQADLQPLHPKQVKELTALSGYLWDCIGQQPNELCGTLYEFKLRDEYDVTISDSPEKQRRIRKKEAEHFPAIELGAYEALVFSSQIRDSKLKLHVPSQMIRQIRPCLATFQKLGFSSIRKPDGVHLFLPSKEALEANWNELRKSSPHLPPLHILSSEGVAEDLEFIEAFLNDDILLSNGNEFVHDMLIHVIPTLLFMMDKSQKYEEHHSRLQQTIRNYLEQITKESSQLIALLAIITDHITTLASCDKAAEYDSKKIDSLIYYALSNDQWIDYFTKRFGSDFNPAILKEKWREISS